MKIDLKTCGYAAIAIAFSAAIVLGSADMSQAAKKKKEVAKAPEHHAMCLGGTPVCATKGGMKMTYASACYAANDGATVVSDKACAEKKMKMKKSAMKKPMKKKEKKM
jgi:hypothetical protein